MNEKSNYLQIVRIMVTGVKKIALNEILTKEIDYIILFSFLFADVV